MAFLAQFCCEAHLEEGEREKTDFLVMLLGYMLTGYRCEQIFTSVKGSGGNGKSVLFTALEQVLGDFLALCNSSLVLVQKHERNANDANPVDFELADSGARLLVLDELKHGQVIDAKAIRKHGDHAKPEVMRRLFGDSHKKTVHASTILSADTEVQIEGGPSAPVIRRVLRVNAGANFGGPELTGELHWKPEFADPANKEEYMGEEWNQSHFPRDKDIQQRLTGTPQARAGVLICLQRGAQRWADKDGDKPARSLGVWPQEWKDATDQMLDEQDYFGMFLEARCAHACQTDPVLPGSVSKIGDVDRAYQAYLKDSHGDVNGGSAKAHLEKRGYKVASPLCGGGADGKGKKETTQIRRWRQPQKRKRGRQTTIHEHLPAGGGGGSAPPSDSADILYVKQQEGGNPFV